MKVNVNYSNQSQRNKTNVSNLKKDTEKGKPKISNLKQAKKKAIEYSNYYTNQGKDTNKGSFVNENLHQNTIDLMTYDPVHALCGPSSIKKYKSNRREISKSHRSCSGEKGSSKSILLATNRILNKMGQKKHMSPIVDRTIIESLRSNNSLLKHSNHVINKVYQNKNKTKVVKITSQKQSSKKGSNLHVSKPTHFLVENKTSQEIRLKANQKPLNQSKNDRISPLSSHSNNTYTFETYESKKSTEFATNESPRDTRTDKLSISSEKHEKQMEAELVRLSSINKVLLKENNSLRSILKDYECLKTNELNLYEQVEKLKAQSNTYLAQISHLNNQVSSLQSKVIFLHKLCLH